MSEEVKEEVVSGKMAEFVDWGNISVLELWWFPHWKIV